MENKFNISVIGLLVVLLIFSINNFFNLRVGEHDKDKVDTLYIASNDHWHTVPFKVEVPVPYKVEVPGTPGATITIPAQIDSLAVVIDYYTKRHYEDSLQNDSIKIKLKYAVFKNKPMDMNIMYKWIAKTMVIERTKVIERQLAFIGGDVMGNATYFGFMPSIYLDSKRAMYGFGYDPFNNIYKVGFYGKVKLWKRKIKP